MTLHNESTREIELEHCSTCNKSDGKCLDCYLEAISSREYLLDTKVLELVLVLKFQGTFLCISATEFKSSEIYEKFAERSASVSACIFCKHGKSKQHAFI